MCRADVSHRCVTQIDGNFQIQTDSHRARQIKPPPHHSSSSAIEKAIRLVAFFEAAKGLIVLIAAAGLLSIIHQDLHAIAAKFIAHMHLNPASKYPHIFLDAAANFKNTKLILLAIAAILYSFMRFIEAYGLFHKRAWAKIFAACSGGIYVPLELSNLIKDPSWLGLALLLINLAIVAVMIRAVMTRDRGTGSEREGA